MKLIPISALVGWITRSVIETPPAPASGGTLVAVLVALLAGGSGMAVFQAWRYRKEGKDSRDTLIGDAADAAVKAAKGMLEEYRYELDAAKREIQEMRDRIARLEGELKNANGDRDRLQRELTNAVERRALLEKRVADLEQIVDPGGRPPG